MDKNSTLPNDMDLENVEASIYLTDENESNAPTFSLELSIKANKWIQEQLSVS